MKEFKSAKAYYHFIPFLLIVITLSLNSCARFLNGIVGPTFIKCYTTESSKTQIKSALNKFFINYSENIVKYDLIVKEHRGFISESTNNDLKQEQIEKEYFYWTIPIIDNIKSDNWRVKSTNGLYLFQMTLLNCKEKEFDCSICLKMALIVNKDDSWKNWDLTSKERRKVLREFEKDILPKIKGIIEKDVK